MKELTDRLAITGTPVTEEDQCYLLIRSLPQSYGYLIPVLCAPKVLDLGTVTNGIVKQEMRTGQDHQEDQALYGSARPAVARKGTILFKITITIAPTCHAITVENMAILVEIVIVRIPVTIASRSPLHNNLPVIMEIKVNVTDANVIPGLNIRPSW